MRKFGGHFVFGLVLLTGAVIFSGVFSWQFYSQAFVGPSTSGGVGSGALGVDVFNNISIGTSTPLTDTRLLVVASSTGSAAWPLRILRPDGTTPILIIRDDQKIGIGGDVGNAMLTVGGSTAVNGTLTANNLAIATSTAGYNLDVFGNARFTGTVIVGTPASDNQAATKSYVDSALGSVVTSTYSVHAYACDGDETCEMNGANLNNGNITGVNKITATTIDPLYEIDGQKFATYGPDMIGVKVEYFGKGKLSRNSDFEIKGANYQYVINFTKLKVGSDLWLFWQTIAEGDEMQDISVVLTPEGEWAKLWYELRPAAKQIAIVGDKPIRFSYHLSAPRHDTQLWPSRVTTPERGVTIPLKP